MAQAVADLEAVRRELNVDRWVVLGHSYGGLLAQSYALAHPDRVLGLVLVCAAFASRVELLPSRQWDLMSPEEGARIREIWASGLPEPQAIYNAHLNGDWKRQSFYRPTEEQVARTVLYDWTPDHDFNERICADWRPLDHAGRFDEFAAPTLLVEATWDLTWNTDKPQVMQQLHPRARLVVFERAGHSPYDDEPEGFFSMLGEFVAGLSP